MPRLQPKRQFGGGAHDHHHPEQTDFYDPKFEASGRAYGPTLWVTPYGWRYYAPMAIVTGLFGAYYVTYQQNPEQFHKPEQLTITQKIAKGSHDLNGKLIPEPFLKNF